MISNAHYVQCDECGDPSEIACFGVKEAHAFAEAQGYVRIRKNGKLADICSRCAEHKAND